MMKGQIVHWGLAETCTIANVWARSCIPCTVSNVECLHSACNKLCWLSGEFVESICHKRILHRKKNIIIICKNVLGAFKFKGAKELKIVACNICWGQRSTNVCSNVHQPALSYLVIGGLVRSPSCYAWSLIGLIEVSWPTVTIKNGCAIRGWQVSTTNSSKQKIETKPK